jgi:hypothetical protein
MAARRGRHNAHEGLMAADFLQKQRRRGTGRPFVKGQSGNPAGRRAGARNKATQPLDGEAAALARKAVDMALAGDALAMRLCLDRIIAPRRERPVAPALPPIRSVADLAGVMAAVADAAARGTISASEAAAWVQFVEIYVRAIDTADFDRRLRLLEDAEGAAGGARRNA